MGVEGKVGTLTGTVFSDADADGVKDPGEAPISDVKICAYKPGSEGSWCATTGPTGTYRFLLPAGTIRMNVTRPPADGTRTTPVDLPTFVEMVVDGTETIDVGYTGVVAPPAPAPQAPAALVATPGSGSARLSWTAAVAPAQAPVSDYVVQRSSSASGPWTTVTDAVGAGTTLTVTGLGNGTRVWFRVAAVNSTGQGDWSPVASTVPRTVPGAPQSVKAAKGKARGTVKVNWAPPASTGGAAITGYQVQYAAKASGPWKTKAVGSSARSAVVKGKKGKALFVRVRAVNAAGAGAWSPVRKAKAR
ncbi:MAG: fibronectin type III domain-containing protein [Candidatus Nanopelagicales bacterium]